MKGNTATFQIDDPAHWKRLAFQWAVSFSPLCYLDSNQYPSNPGSYECLIGAGSARSVALHEAPGAFDRLRNCWEERSSWLFGHLSYDLKNDVECLESRHEDHLGFPVLHFFEPLHVLELLPGGALIITCLDGDPREVFEAIKRQKPPSGNQPFLDSQLKLQPRIGPAEYLEKIVRLQEHILEGDIYEANFCQEFFAENCRIDAPALFQQLNQLSRAPFSAYYRHDDRYLLCASPERFLRKEGALLTSQPIKGTLHRGRDAEEDLIFREQLENSEKDRAENVMIVDLVRNDLARSCVPGSVNVPELFGIYPFPQVFQMISTVTGQLREEVSFFDAIRWAFPMGSMTGAPKVRAMELIEDYEESRRGLYSGALGYITPRGDFDFNVVIRSLLYNQARSYLSFQVGGAIVYDSAPEREYEECLWKARALLTVLGQDAASMTKPSDFRSSQKRG